MAIELKTIICDLDGVLCEEGPRFKRAIAKPILENIEKINTLADKGLEIIIFTARSWEEYAITKHWLDSFDVAYDRIICGKPPGNYYIDDRNYTLEELTNDYEDVPF